MPRIRHVHRPSPRLSIAYLTPLANRGAFEAARFIALAAADEHDSIPALAARRVVSTFTNSLALNAAWSVWNQRRSVKLLSALKETGLPAKNPVDVQVLSLLALNSAKENFNHPEMIPALAEACLDKNPDIAQNALVQLEQLTGALANAFCAYAFRSRKQAFEDLIRKKRFNATAPASVRVYTRLLNNDIHTLTRIDADAIPDLVAFTGDKSKDLASRARQALLQLKNETAINRFCRLWVDTRKPELEQILLQSAYLPSDSAGMRYLVALKLGRLDEARKLCCQSAEQIISAYNDSDPTIQRNCLATLDSVDESVKQSICDHFMDTGDLSSQKICMEMHWQPNQPDRRALFLILSNQIDQYLHMDFDQSLLRFALAGAAPEIRQRAARSIQSSGYVNLLEVLVDHSFRIVTTNASHEDILGLVDALKRQKQFDQLWELAIKSPVHISLDILNHLVETGYSPQTTHETGLFRQLAAILSEIKPIGRTDPLPPAILRASFRVPGNVNDLAFHPVEPWIAFATGRRTVALWDYSKGEMARIIRGAGHSVARVEIDSTGNLFLAERTNANAACKIWTLAGESLVPTGSHTGGITGLVTLADGNLLTTGRDYCATLWSTRTHEPIRSITLPSLPRALMLSPIADEAVALCDQPVTLNLRDLRVSDVLFRRPRVRGLVKSPYHCGALDPTGECLIAGQFNGQVVALQRELSRPDLPYGLLQSSSRPIRTVTYHTHQKKWMVGSTDGIIAFYDHDFDQKIAGLVMPSTEFRSLSIHENGQWMIVCEVEQKCSLWDLSIQAIPDLLTQPMGLMNPHDLALCQSWAVCEGIPDETANLIELVSAILQYRFRNDILVEDFKPVLPGEYDIIVDPG
ncbi:MAG: hypothetical protein HY835_14595 [Anaerolineae bacterium]|nr:hypothetical protein [Anaerolineae bacterium]